MASSSFIDTIRNSISGLFSPTPTVPFSPIPGDVISVFFSLLGEREKVNLGKACKALNAAYINVSPVGFGSKQIYANLKDAAVELAKANQGQHLSRQLSLKAQQESANFYNNFSKTLKTLNTTSSPESYGYFGVLANQIIRSSFKIANVDRAKTDTVTRGFNQSYFYDLCALYASQPIETITIESFKAKVASIRQSFAQIATIDIETELRQAIKSKHDSTEFNHIRMNLQPAALDAAARDKATKMDHFYLELDQAVGARNQYARSQALHHITG